MSGKIQVWYNGVGGPEIYEAASAGMKLDGPTTLTSDVNSYTCTLTPIAIPE